MKLINCGMRGMEVVHTNHSQSDERHFTQLCNSNNLIKTGGSDFHGILNREMLIGGKKIPYEYVEELKRFKPEPISTQVNPTSIESK